MKKLLVLMMALLMTVSIAACGGDESSASAEPDVTPAVSESNPEESVELVEFTGNGITLMVPADFTSTTMDESNGNLSVVNKENPAAITISEKKVDSISSDDITDEVLISSITYSGMIDGTLDRSSRYENDGGTSVVGFGQGKLDDGSVMNTVIQFYILADGSGYHVVSYLYEVGSDSSLEGTIEQVASSVKPAE